MQKPDTLVLRPSDGGSLGSSICVWCILHARVIPRVLNEDTDYIKRGKKRREGFCLRLEKLHIPLFAFGKCLKTKIKKKKTLQFLVLVNSCGVNSPPWLTQLAVLALRSWHQELFPCKSVRRPRAAPLTPLNEAHGAVA